MKRAFAFFASVLMLSLTLTGCSGVPLQSSKNPVTLTMWHNYGGDMQQIMDSLIDEFNVTVGKEKGIRIDVTAISSSSDLNRSLDMIASGDPGAPEMPDIFTGYPKIAMQFYEKDLLVNFDDYISDKALSGYVDAFVSEGRLADGGLYVFPIAKSTEILYLNQTLFDEFAAQTGADVSLLSTFEGIVQLSEAYYAWSGGKQFFAADSWFNTAAVGMEQLGGSIFKEDHSLNLNSGEYRRIFETFYAPAVRGGVALYSGYSSDLSKTGDLVCSTGSSAGILFYGDTITYEDGTVLPVEYSVFPYPVFSGGEKRALQRGGGLMASKSDPKREQAAADFILWLTAPQQNMRFIEKTGYLPVTKQAFEQDLQPHMERVTDVRIRKLLSAVLSMYRDYTFFTAPNFSELDELSKNYEADFLKLLSDEQDAYLKSSAFSADAALEQLIG